MPRIVLLVGFRGRKTIGSGTLLAFGLPVPDPQTLQAKAEAIQFQSCFGGKKETFSR